MKNVLDGMLVQFKCNSDQMQIKGPKVIKCTEHGNYSSAPPTCEKRPSKSIFESLFYSFENIAIKFRFPLISIKELLELYEKLFCSVVQIVVCWVSYKFQPSLNAEILPYKTRMYN